MKLFKLIASKSGQVVFDDRIEAPSPREAREQMKALLGLQSLTGVVYAITEIPVDLIQSIVDARLAESMQRVRNGEPPASVEALIRPLANAAVREQLASLRAGQGPVTEEPPVAPQRFDAFATAVQRRQMAVQSGAWWRGRMLAIGFTLLGIAIVAAIVGDRRLATAEGIVTFSLAFTIWSFLGLLTLPTPSRRGVEEIDQRMLAAGCQRAVLARTMGLLDDLQDRERARSSLVETIFHPVPSVQSRLRGPRSTGGHGCWDAARTAVYVSAAGLGLIRAKRLSTSRAP
jgi:hypothetical protein